MVRDRNDHLASLQLYVESGITKNLDVTVNTGGDWLDADRRRDIFHLIDTQIFLGFQFLRDEKGTCKPDFRFMLGENFPTGKFDRLDPRLNFAEVTGSGAFATWIIFVWQKIFYTRPKHPYKWNLNLAYTFPGAVRTRDLSVYGGGPKVIGVAHPGQLIQVNLSYEYKFGKHWGWGLDIHYDHTAPSNFKALTGVPLSQAFPLLIC